MSPRRGERPSIAKMEREMKTIYFFIILGVLSGCAMSDSQVREAVKKNPAIVFDVIEENPERFLEVVNRAAQKAQEAQYKKRLEAMQAEQEEDIKNPRKPSLDNDRRLAGTEKGKVVIVEYADFQCPACQMAYKSLKEFKSKYKDQVQFYYKHMPLNFHEMAFPSALYFEAIRLQDKAKALKFYQIVFENQQALSEGFLKQTAKSVGANMNQLSKDIKSDKVRAIVEADIQEFEKFGFTGTPVTIVNGIALKGAQGVDALERAMKLTVK